MEYRPLQQPKLRSCARSEGPQIGICGRPLLGMSVMSRVPAIAASYWEIS